MFNFNKKNVKESNNPVNQPANTTAFDFNMGLGVSAEQSQQQEQPRSPADSNVAVNSDELDFADGNIAVKKSNKKALIFFLVLLLVVGGGITAYVMMNKSKEPEVPPEPVYNIVSTDFDSEVAEFAYDYINYLRAGDISKGYKCVSPQSTLFSEAMYAEVPYVKDLVQGNVPESLYSLNVYDGEISFMFADKKSEVYTQPTKRELKKGVTPQYVGDNIMNTYTIDLQYSYTDKGIKFYLPESDLSDEIIAVKTLDKCRVYLYDTLLDARERDEDGYYLLSGFLRMPQLPVRIETDVEVLNIDLDLEGTSTDAFFVEHPKGYRAFDFTNWFVSRQTKEDATEWAADGLQIVLDSIEAQQGSFLESKATKVFSTKSNLEVVKPYYERMAKRFLNADNLRYEDLTVIGVTPVSERVLENNNLVENFITGEYFVLYFDIDYSYYLVRLNKSTGTETSRSIQTGKLSRVPVYFTQDNGKWRFYDIGERFFKSFS